MILSRCRKFDLRGVSGSPGSHLTCLGVIHDFAFSIAAWVFQDHLQVVHLQPSGAFARFKIESRIPEGALTTGLLHQRQDGLWEVILGVQDRFGVRRTQIFEFNEGQGVLHLGPIVLPGEVSSRERASHTPWGRRSISWGKYGPDQIWSSIMSGNKVRRAWKHEEMLHLETLTRQRRKLRSGPEYSFLSKGSVRKYQLKHTWWFDADLVDIHPTRGDLLLLHSRLSHTYAVVHAKRTSWWWIPLRVHERPTWTRLWFKSFEGLLRPFEFWNGMIFSLRDGTPERTEL